jgi:outer membrane protein OmpA-like peptidoglycan-associated protein
MLLSLSCTRPLGVTHWDGKGVALINKSIASRKKNGYGYPKHTQLSRIICFNESCINKVEWKNKQQKNKFRQYKNNSPLPKKPTEDTKSSPPLIVEKQEPESRANTTIPINQPQVFQHVYFETGKAILDKSSVEELDQLVVLLEANPALLLHVSGHTDDTGDSRVNQKLSLNRAEAVVNYLISKGVNKSRLQATGYGSLKPLASNSSKQGRNTNRRVEFILLEAGK